MTVSITERAAATNTAATTHNCGTLSSAPSSGATVVIVAGVSDANPTAPAGFTLDVSRSGGGNGAFIWSKQAGAGEPTEYTFTTGAADNSEVQTYVLASASATVDQTATGAVNPGTSIQVTTGALSQASSFAVMGAWNVSDNGGGEAIDESFTVRETVAFDQFVTGDKITTVTTALTPTVSWTNSVASTAVIATYPEQLSSSGSVQDSVANHLNRLAGTTELEAAGAANVWAGTTDLELAAALNAVAGTTDLEVLGALRAIASNQGVDTTGDVSALLSRLT